VLVPVIVCEGLVVLLTDRVVVAVGVAVAIAVTVLLSVPD